MAVNKTVGRPAQYKQGSRKGKKAWRKNIDLTEIEQSITEKQEREISHGAKELATLSDDVFFQVDDAGDELLKEKLIKRKQINKKLKSREILDAIKTNSKVKAIESAHHGTSTNKKVQGVSKREMTQLLALAGRVKGESKLKSRVQKEGLLRSESLDAWNQKDEKVKLPFGLRLKSPKVEVPESVLKDPSTGWSLARNKPKTIDRATEKVKEFETLPHAGKSYNPDSSNWSALFTKEAEREQEKERIRLAMEDYKAKIAHLMDIIDDNEEESSSSDDNEEDHEGESGDDETNHSNSIEDTTKLSLNDAVKNKKKTKYQRNKAARHEEKLRLQAELKKLNKHLKELEKIEEIDLSLTKAQIDATPVSKQKKNKHHKLGSKYSALDERLEIKFKDELSSSLRKLKPEGNLLYDAVRKLQSTGKIETRLPISQRRKNRRKITEKWSHKDFK